MTETLFKEFCTLVTQTINDVFMYAAELEKKILTLETKLELLEHRIIDIERE